MYLPKHFDIADREEIFSFIDANAFGQLISISAGRPTASHLPFLVADERNYLLCHLARQNSQWQDLAEQQVLVTFQGPHDYISPNWYRNPGVPTWNYQAVHVYGHCRVFEDAPEIAPLVEALTARYEAALPSPWKPRYTRAMLAGIVGVEIEISDIQCKYKLNQNRPESDHQPVIDQLEQRGSTALARAMRKSRL